MFHGTAKKSVAGESSNFKSTTSEEQTDLSGTSSAENATSDKLE